MLVGLLISWAGLQLYKGITGSVYRSLELDGIGRVWQMLLMLLRTCSFAGFVVLGSILAGTG